MLAGMADPVACQARASGSGATRIWGLVSVIHIRHIKTALEAQFEEKIDLSDWAGAAEEDREAVFLSRALAAYMLSQLADVEPTTAGQGVTDGGQDNGIDALHLDPASHNLLVVQSKWDADGRGSPAVGDVQKLVQGFQDLINGRFDRFNKRVRARQTELTEALDDPNVTFTLVFAHTGQNEVSEDAKRILDDLLGELNDTTDVVAYRFLKQADIHRLVRGSLEGEAIELEVALQDWGLTQEPFVAYYGQIEASDVAAWWEAYGTRLFARNLRRFIPDSEVNESIVKTLLEDPENFWYFNNGVTVLAEKIAKKPIGGADRRTGHFVCQGVTVVNGAQTVGCIGTAQDRDAGAVERARVSVRFISLENCPEDFATNVTRATNTQNRIERRDFVSLDPEQDRLRTDLRLENGKSYAIKTGEPDPPPEAGCSVTEATVALACALTDPTLAVQAKREIGRLWEDITKAPYKQIFNPTVSGLRLWRAVEVLRSVEAVLRGEQNTREGRARGVAVHGNRLVLHLVFRSLHGDIGDPAFDFDAVLRLVPEKTVRALDRLTEMVEREYPANYLASLFKNATKCRYLVDLLFPPAPA